MTDSKVLQRLIDFAPTIIDRWARNRNRCIAATAVGCDVLHYFDVDADPLPVVVQLVNRAYVAAAKRGADPVVAVARGGHILVTAPESNEAGWAGHLVIHVPRRQVLIDLDFQQFGRPQHHIDADPAEVLDWPTGTTAREFRNPINGSRLIIEVTTDTTYTTAPDWYDVDRRVLMVDAVIRAIKKNRL